MSTFNSIEGSRQLQVKSLHECFTLIIEYKDAGRSGLTLAPSDAPALALAILEAAGYGEEVVTDGSPDGHVRVAKYYLYEGVKAHASITAEAKAQAELEAEALELYQLWETLQSDDETVWLAVARRAREMRAGK